MSVPLFLLKPTWQKHSLEKFWVSKLFSRGKHFCSAVGSESTLAGTEAQFLSLRLDTLLVVDVSYPFVQVSVAKQELLTPSKFFQRRHVRGPL